MARSNRTAPAEAQSRMQSSTLTQDEGAGYLGALRPVVKMMLADIEKNLIACKRGEISLDTMQENLHRTVGILGVSLVDGGTLS